MAETDFNQNIVDGLQAIVKCCNMVIQALTDKEPAQVTAEPIKEEATAEKTEAAKEPEKPKITKEMVRQILADKSRKGYREQVKALLTKYNSPDISHLDPADYPKIIKEAEEIGDAG